jgi:hypothetical protein
VNVLTCCQCDIPFHTKCLQEWYETKQICTCPHCGYTHEDCIYCEHIEQLQNVPKYNNNNNSKRILMYSCLIIGYITGIVTINEYFDFK